MRTGLGGADSDGVVAIGQAAGVGSAAGSLSAIDTDINADDGIRVGYAEAAEVAASPTATGNLVIDGISPAATVINLNNGDLQVGRTDIEAPEGTVFTVNGSASIQDVTIRGGEVQVGEIDANGDGLTIVSTVPAFSMNNVTVVANEIDSADAFAGNENTSATVNVNSSLTDVRFVDVDSTNNFQLGRALAINENSVASSSSTHEWRRVSIEAEGDIQIGESDSLNGGEVTQQTQVDIYESSLAIDDFRVVEVVADNIQRNSNNTTITLAQGSELIADQLSIARITTDEASRVDIDASLTISESTITLGGTMILGEIQGDSNNIQSRISANLILNSTILTADDLVIAEVDGSLPATFDARLSMNPSLISADEVFLNADGEINFGINGLERVTEATVGNPDGYAAINANTAVLSGEIIADLGFVPPTGQYDFDLLVASTSIDASAATLTVANLPPLFGVVSFGVVSENDNQILRLTLAGGNDLAVTQSASLNGAEVGDTITYRIGVSNLGNDAAIGVGVTDLLPPELGSASWTCAAASGASCGQASGSGNIDSTVDLPGGASVEFELTAVIVGGAQLIINTAQITPPAGFIDGVSDNNSATVETELVLFRDRFETK
ncbi:MAG: DUF11 domain-containing protein [Pseudomonadota bacterium]